MAIYHYTAPSPVERIDMRASRNGSQHATLLLSPGTDPAQIQHMRSRLGEKHFSSLVDVVDGRTLLKVHGLRNAQSLLSHLEALGFTQGTARQETTAEDALAPRGLLDRIKQRSLLLSALFYDLGNAAFFASGIQRGRHNKDGKLTSNDKSEIMIGAAFSVGDILMTVYGGERGDAALSAAALGMQQQLQQDGLTSNKDVLRADAPEQKGALKTVDGWLRHNIIRIKCLTEFAGGLFTMHSARKPGNFNGGKFTAGMLIAGGWLTTLFLDKPQKHTLFHEDAPAETLGEKITTNPRGWIARPLAMANNVSNLWGSLNPLTGERARFQREVQEAERQLSTADTEENRSHLAYTKAKRHDYVWNVISACAFLVAHTLFGLSGSKRTPQTTEEKAQTLQDLIVLSANMVMQQPEPSRSAAITSTAQYVTSLLPADKQEIKVVDMIRDKVELLTRAAGMTQAQLAAASQQRAA